MKQHLGDVLNLSHSHHPQVPKCEAYEIGNAPNEKNDLRDYPRVNYNNYGKTHLFMGKLKIKGHVQ